MRLVLESGSVGGWLVPKPYSRMEGREVGAVHKIPSLRGNEAMWKSFRHNSDTSRFGLENLFLN